MSFDSDKIYKKESIENKNGDIVGKHGIMSWKGEIFAKGNVISQEGSIYGEYGIIGRRIYAKSDIISWKGPIMSSGDIVSDNGEIYSNSEIMSTEGGVIGNKITTDEIFAKYISCEYLRGNSKLRPKIELARCPDFEVSCYVGSDISRLFDVKPSLF